MAHGITRFSLDPSLCLPTRSTKKAQSPSPRHNILHSIHSSSFISFPLSRPTSGRNSASPPRPPQSNPRGKVSSRNFSPMLIRSSVHRPALSLLSRVCSVRKVPKFPGRGKGLTERTKSAFRKRPILRERKGDGSPGTIGRIHGVASHREKAGQRRTHVTLPTTRAPINRLSLLSYRTEDRSCG